MSPRCRSSIQFGYEVDTSVLASFPTRRSSDLVLAEEVSQQVLLRPARGRRSKQRRLGQARELRAEGAARGQGAVREERSEEHTSELQSLTNLVCRLLLDKRIVEISYICRLSVL